VPTEPVRGFAFSAQESLGSVFQPVNGVADFVSELNLENVDRYPKSASAAFESSCRRPGGSKLHLRARAVPLHRKQQPLDIDAEDRAKEVFGDQVCRSFEFALDESFLDHNLGGDICEFAPLPSFDLLAHRFEASLHPIHTHRDAMD
jgi:hypothetical protein